MKKEDIQGFTKNPAFAKIMYEASKLMSEDAVKQGKNDLMSKSGLNQEIAEWEEKMSKAIRDDDTETMNKASEKLLELRMMQQG